VDDRESLFAEVPAGRAQAVPSGSLALGRTAGIEIRVHYTWLIAFALITYSLAVGLFPDLIPGRSQALYWLVGATAALLLFGSVLVHEMCHSLVAKSRGIPVSSITLFIFGGVSNIQQEPENPGQEFLIAVVGPVSSLVLAAVCWGLLQMSGGAAAPIQALLVYLALINFVLGVFNLLPAFPLDGGRVLRAIIWAITGDLYRATNWAAGIGQVFAFLLIILGILQIFGGNFLGGIWIAFIGWFLNGAAESSRRQTVVRESFRGVRVAQLMTPNPPIVSPMLPIQAFVSDYALRRGTRALLVGQGGQLVGIVTLTDLHKLPADRWGEANVGQLMTRAPLITVGPNADLQSALRQMDEHDLNQLPVVEDGQVIGLLTRANVIRYLRLRDELGVLPPSLPTEDEHRRAA
jgi:Zn-dependent protease/CBS domain-containing protein